MVNTTVPRPLYSRPLGREGRKGGVVKENTSEDQILQYATESNRTLEGKSRQPVVWLIACRHGLAPTVKFKFGQNGDSRSSIF